MSLEVCPEALQARQHVAVLRQLYLRLGVGRLCTHGKDVKDEARAVEDLDLLHLLDVAQLLGRELIVEDDHRHFPFGILFRLYEGAYLLQLANAEVGDAVRPPKALGEATHRLCTGSLGQELQLIEVFLRFALVLTGRDDANEYSSLGRVVDDIMELYIRHAVLKGQRRA